MKSEYISPKSKDEIIDGLIKLIDMIVDLDERIENERYCQYGHDECTDCYVQGLEYAQDYLECVSDYAQDLRIEIKKSSSGSVAGNPSDKQLKLL